MLPLDVAGGEAARPNDKLVGQADQIHGGVFGAEIEGLADLDAPGSDKSFRRYGAGFRLVYLARRGVQRRKIVDDRLYNLLVVVIDIGIFEIQIEEIAINIDFALAGLGQNDEFMAEI